MTAPATDPQPVIDPELWRAASQPLIGGPPPPDPEVWAAGWLRSIEEDLAAARPPAPDTADHELVELVEQLGEQGLPALYADPWLHRGRWVLTPGLPMYDVTALLAWAEHLDDGAVIAHAQLLGPTTLLQLTGRLAGRLVVLSGCTGRRVRHDRWGLVELADLAVVAAAEQGGAVLRPGPAAGDPLEETRVLPAPVDVDVDVDPEPPAPGPVAGAARPSPRPRPTPPAPARGEGR